MNALAAIIDVMKTAHGMDISMFDQSFLSMSVEKFSSVENATTPGEYSALIAADRKKANELLESLNVCYSEFFRNPMTFALLEQMILPAIIEKKQPGSGIRVWSSACAAGQEPYSISILLEDLICRKEKNTRFRVFGTDISEKELEKARKGIYNFSEIQNLSMGIVKKYFDQDGDNYIIADSIKNHLDFSFHDLLDQNAGSPASSIFGDFDLVCCCNLLYYYNPGIRQQIINRLYDSLSPGGFLVTGEAERDILARYKFRPVIPTACVFQKIR